jgi:tetratricopeptide (TPR) repeat protein
MPAAAVWLLAIASIQAQIPPPSDAMNKGVQAFRIGAYAEAANYFKQAAAQDPQSVTARSYLATTYMMPSIAQLYFHQKKLDEARVWYKKAIGIDPKAKTSHYSIGVPMARRAAKGDEDALVARAFSRPCRHSRRHAFNRVFKGAVAREFGNYLP